MNDWQDVNNVVVVGLGITGLSVVKYLRRYHPDIAVKVIDTRDNPPGLSELPAGIACYQGGWCNQWLAAADLVVINPGIALATPEIQHVIQAGTPVVGDIELFARHIDKPVIAITGSNGKSTVTDLTGKMAAAAGLRVAVGGNIGVPALDLIDESVDLYVLELSSFQLETTSHLKLKAAAFLNLSEDHMDRYRDIDGYRQAKLRIFMHAEAAIVNRDDPATFPEMFSGEVVTFSISQAADFALQSNNGREYLMANGHPVIACDQLRLVGRHNLANVLTVFALLQQSGICYEKGLEVLKSYTGLTHRCQVVEDNRGIQWVNDSKATNVASTLAALSGLTLNGTLYLLVGGVGKGADFSPLAPVLSSLNVRLCCFGRDGQQFMQLHPAAKQYETMADAIADIAPQLLQGDIVMLSPACASFDQFKNFMARGDAFADLAHQYA
ncbi:UDP-N-acetylmuramoyl-L-alanine--D-glutamate ligase [Vibrio rhizosphaerae]|uniref:UDP-N-acetylmuramoylalanine--D-glutamate ligase n=1 Tax=Vibrio rhizosphaerae TaxID=398736 RepID=A0ABU4IWH2_9VIBR|nr:UDP-N-acetylmuramoyl-L-alanine--D-glutamate ligase [Vibrio rhizosphaerae]MDW6093744.1 UDP-N-acetylmuramoyl-L-alanine--D-glutamate ligase [Vibrio rhizosphaerae]